jgi:hypothetical protein
LVGKLQGRITHRWEDNIKMDLRDTEGEGSTEFNWLLVGSNTGACKIFYGTSLCIKKGIL